MTTATHIIDCYEKGHITMKEAFETLVDKTNAAYKNGYITEAKKKKCIEQITHWYEGKIDHITLWVYLNHVM